MYTFHWRRTARALSEDDNQFEYIPVPADRPTMEKRTYGTIPCANISKKYGKWLSDFMHVDSLKYPVGSGKEAPPRRGPRKAKNIKPHFDPEWGDNCTFGINYWTKYLPGSAR